MSTACSHSYLVPLMVGDCRYVIGDDWMELWLSNAKLPDRDFVVYGAATYCARLRHTNARALMSAVFRAHPGCKSAVPSDADLMATPAAAQLIGSSRPLAVTQRTLMLWRDILLDLHVSDPILVVSATGSGKSASVAALALILGQRCQVVALTPESEPGDLIGQLTPSEQKGALVE